MFRYISLAVVLVASLIASDILSAERRGGRIERIGDLTLNEIKDLRLEPSLATSDTCMVRSDSGIMMRIDGWVIGQELYKQYLDPAQSCPNPYPFTVLEINMPMIFDAPGTIVVSVDLEAVDLSDPGCPMPGLLIDSSTWWQYTIPAAGMYNIWVPLDTPVAVNGPFFAGFLISNALTMNAAVLTDTTRVPCVSYNIWDVEIGFIDLGQYIYDDGSFYFEWPGTLVLYASGIPGGAEPETEPAPEIVWVSPVMYDSVLYSTTELWALETSGSSIISHVLFEYSSGGAFQDIGLAFDGSVTNRNGIDPTITAMGYTIPWDFSNLSEGEYTLRVTAVDTLGRSASATKTVVLEPTPPIPNIVSPTTWSTFCTNINFLVTCPDENLSHIEFKGRAIPDDYSIGLFELDQSMLGDVDFDPYDGNHVADGEFGDYYCGPVAAAVAIQEWSDRGFAALMRTGPTTHGILDVAELLAALFDTRARHGTRDDLLVRGLQQWTSARDTRVRVDYRRHPDYIGLRTWVQDDERVVLLGLGGSRGIWVTVDGFLGWETAPNSYVVSVMNPLSGSIEDVQVREIGGSAEVQIDNEWLRVEIMVSLLATNWSPARALLGADMYGGDGWSLLWTPNPLTEGDYFFMWAAATDATQYKGHTSVLMQYTCENTYVPGDYNNDGHTDIADLYYLIQYITHGGPAPVGGPQRADVNCDTYINIADIVYYMNYLYGVSSPPCY